MTNIKHNQYPALTPELEDVVIGTLLGDAKLTFSDLGNAAYVCEQGDLHKDYIDSLFKLFKDYTKNDSLTEYTRVDKRTDKVTVSYHFSTVTLPIFYQYVELFYVKVPDTRRVIKVVPANISDLLTPRALAYWIMDDGQYVKRGGVTLCTDSFTLDEVNLLKGVLENKFGLICTLHVKNKGNRIYISGKSLPLLRAELTKYMHPSFMYKLAH